MQIACEQMSQEDKPLSDIERLENIYQQQEGRIQAIVDRWDSDQAFENLQRD